MKEAIIGYVTGMVNNHQLISESVEKSGETIALDFVHNAVAGELSDLLDFIEDTKEEKINPMQVTLHKNQDEELLRKRIRELEDSCENFAQVERNLLNKNEQLKGLLAESLEFLPQGHRNLIKKVLEGK